MQTGPITVSEALEAMRGDPDLVDLARAFEGFVERRGFRVHDAAERLFDEPRQVPDWKTGPQTIRDVLVAMRRAAVLSDLAQVIEQWAFRAGVDPAAAADVLFDEVPAETCEDWDDDDDDDNDCDDCSEAFAIANEIRSRIGAALAPYWYERADPVKDLIAEHAGEVEQLLRYIVRQTYRIGS